MNKRIIINLFSFMAFFMALQLVGFSYSASQSFSSIPTENIQEEETTHKHCEAKQLAEKVLSCPSFSLADLLGIAWPEHFLKDSINERPTTPPPRPFLA